MKKNKLRFILCAALLLLGAVFMRPVESVKAEDAGQVYVSDIDYENLTMRVYLNGNSFVYYSATMNTDLTAWDQVSGEPMEGNGGKKYLLMDISWTNPTVSTIFYLRGDKNITALKIELPKQDKAFKVIFDKANGTFTMQGQEEASYFYYRKSTDYNWIKVNFEDAEKDGGIKYSEFISNIEMLRFKGAKLYFKLGQTMGTGVDAPGLRPSKEMTVTISKYASAPSVKLNITKLTFNTKNTMEYSENINSAWTVCEKTMKLEDFSITNEYYYSKTKPLADAMTLYFRVAKTDKKPASQICVVQIPSQKAAPTVEATGNADVNYEYKDGKLFITFNTASKETPFEYWVDKDDSGDFSKAKWKTVKNAKTVSLTSKAADNADIYFRFKGVNANTTKHIDLELPSRCACFTANGFPAVE